MEGFLVWLGVLGLAFGPSALLGFLPVLLERSIPEIAVVEEVEEPVFSFEIGLFVAPRSA